jgi:hypothetical protein
MEGIDAGLARCEELGIRYATEVCVTAINATSFDNNTYKLALYYMLKKVCMSLFGGAHITLACSSSSSALARMIQYVYCFF